MSETIFNYRKLIVWQKAMQLTEIVYEAVKKFPPEERYALSDQLRRAVVSIASNIAEGAGRATNKDFASTLPLPLPRLRLSTSTNSWSKKGEVKMFIFTECMSMLNQIMCGKCCLLNRIMCGKVDFAIAKKVVV